MRELGEEAVDDGVVPRTHVLDQLKLDVGEPELFGGGGLYPRGSSRLSWARRRRQHRRAERGDRRGGGRHIAPGCEAGADALGDRVVREERFFVHFGKAAVLSAGRLCCALELYYAVHELWWI